MHRSRITLSFLVLISLLTSAMFSVRANESERDVKVASYNMYLGADLSDIFFAQSQFELVTEVGEAYTDMQAGLPLERIDEIADQIASGEPDVVALQEVALWRFGFPQDPAPAEAVAYDFLQILLDRLADRGLHYTPVAIQTNLDAELTGVFGPESALDVRYTDRLVMIARADLSTSRIKIEGSANGTFETLLTVPLLGTPFAIPRGWTSVDIKHRGKTYRIVNAHLEAFHPSVQFVQALELLAGPTVTELPVLLTGDFNSGPNYEPATYSLLVGSGFTDVWTVVGSGGPGYTWPLSQESPAAIVSPVLRIDHMLTRGSLTLSNMDLLGEDPTLDLTISQMRPSDHAGLIATVVLEP